MPQIWVALEQPERVRDGVNQGPVELEQILRHASGEDNFRHASAGVATFAEVATKVI